MGRSAKVTCKHDTILCRSVHGFWCLCGSWNQPPANTRGQLCYLIIHCWPTPVSHTEKQNQYSLTNKYSYPQVCI